MALIDLDGRVVIVTGASSGIGEAAARRLQEAGSHPVLAARREDRLSALSAELGDALAVPTDVTSPADVNALVTATLQRHGRLDGLVNNAGVALHGPIDSLDPEEFRRVLDVNVVSVLTCTQAVLPAMRRAGFGRIVNVSSGTTRGTATGVGGYASTKVALNHLTAVARAELAGAGIDVSLVVPSMTATEFNGGRYQLGSSPRPGVIVHSADYVGRAIVRALRTGEAVVDIPHGEERDEVVDVQA